MIKPNVGGRPQEYDDAYHKRLKEQVKRSQASRNELKTAIHSLVLFQLHNNKESLLKPVSLNPLPKFYNGLADELYRKYGEAFTREDIENQVRSCVGKSAGQLKQQLNRIEKKLKSNAIL